MPLQIQRSLALMIRQQGLAMVWTMEIEDYNQFETRSDKISTAG